MSRGYCGQCGHAYDDEAGAHECPPAKASETCQGCHGTREIDAREQVGDGPIRRYKAPCPWCRPAAPPASTEIVTNSNAAAYESGLLRCRGCADRDAEIEKLKAEVDSAKQPSTSIQDVRLVRAVARLRREREKEGKRGSV